MKALQKFPMPLTQVCKELEEIGVEATVYRAAVDFDQRAVGTDVTITLEMRVKDIWGERDTAESAFERAMGIIE